MLLGSPSFVGQQMRFQAHADREYFQYATEDLPKTPDGQNPYVVFDITPTEHTKMEEMAKHFKTLAVKWHPDREGGSHDKMAELNAAYKIIKKHHKDVVRKIGEHRNMDPDQRISRERSGFGGKAAKAKGPKTQKEKFEEALGRAGGLRQNLRTMHSKKARSAAEIQTAWELFREDRETAAEKISGRFNYAMKHCLYYDRHVMVREMIYKEKWMRKQFCRGIWEDVNGLRAELIRKGHRNPTMKDLAEEMVEFARETEEKLTQELQREAELNLGRGIVRWYLSLAKIIGKVLFVVWCLCALSITIFENQWMVQYKEALFGA